MNAIQFYAFPDEISDFIRAVQKEFHYYIVRIEHPPWCAELIATKDDDGSAFELTPGSYNLYTYLPDLSIKNQTAFRNKHINATNLDIGSLSADSLDESVFGTIADKEDIAFVQAKKIASKLKKITKAGVIFKNVDTNAEALSRTHRYTKLVQEKCAEGLRLISVGCSKLVAYPKV
jgi:hypothetical protein